MIRFACPHCNTRLKAHDDRAGATMPCPDCRQPVVVPAAVALDDLMAGRTQLPPLRLLLPVVRAAAWGVCLLWAGVVVLNYLSAYSQGSPNAIQEAGLASGSCFWVIVAYVGARAIDSATRWERTAP
jgi:hypothetical protein